MDPVDGLPEHRRKEGNDGQQAERSDARICHQVHVLADPGRVRAGPRRVDSPVLIALANAASQKVIEAPLNPVPERTAVGHGRAVAAIRGRRQRVLERGNQHDDRAEDDHGHDREPVLAEGHSENRDRDQEPDPDAAGNRREYRQAKEHQARRDEDRRGSPAKVRRPCRADGKNEGQREVDRRSHRMCEGAGGAKELARVAIRANEAGGPERGCAGDALHVVNETDQVIAGLPERLRKNQEGSHAEYRGPSRGGDEGLYQRRCRDAGVSRQPTKAVQLDGDE